MGGPATGPQSSFQQGPFPLAIKMKGWDKEAGHRESGGGQKQRTQVGLPTFHGAFRMVRPQTHERDSDLH